MKNTGATDRGHNGTKKVSILCVIGLRLRVCWLKLLRQQPIQQPLDPRVAAGRQAKAEVQKEEGPKGLLLRLPREQWHGDGTAEVARNAEEEVHFLPANYSFEDETSEEAKEWLAGVRVIQEVKGRAVPGRHRRSQEGVEEIYLEEYW